MTSLCSTMRLSSFTTKGPTHTEADETRWEVWLVVGRASNTQKTHSLCGSGNRFCSWSCLHNEVVHGNTRTRGIRGRASQNDLYFLCATTRTSTNESAHESRAKKDARTSICEQY